jgi:hypothetical protein
MADYEEGEEEEGADYEEDELSDVEVPAAEFSSKIASTCDIASSSPPVQEVPSTHATKNHEVSTTVRVDSERCEFDEEGAIIVPEFKKGTEKDQELLLHFNNGKGLVCNKELRRIFKHLGAPFVSYRQASLMIRSLKPDSELDGCVTPQDIIDALSSC